MFAFKSLFLYLSLTYVAGNSWCPHLRNLRQYILVFKYFFFKTPHPTSRSLLPEVTSYYYFATSSSTSLWILFRSLPHQESVPVFHVVLTYPINFNPLHFITITIINKVLRHVILRISLTAFGPNTQLFTTAGLFFLAHDWLNAAVSSPVCTAPNV
jgi:hypothetical protein